MSETAPTPADTTPDGDTGVRGGARGGLKRTLGLTSLTFYGVGTIIGAGIYSVIGAAAGEAGRVLWMSFALGAFCAALTGLSYAELASTFPRAGAEYVYLRRALPGQRWASFGIGALVALTGATTAATVALSFAGYLGVFVEFPGLVTAAALLAACTALNIAGIKQSSRVNMVLTSVEAVGLVLVIGAGVRTPGFAESIAVTPHLGVIPAAALIFFVYTGFEGLANLSEEAERPERNVPLALLLSLGITTVLYVLVALTTVALASPEELSASDSPLAMAAGNAAPWLGTTLGVIALVATANTALISFIVGSRVLFGMARAGEMPRSFARTLPGRRTPWVAALVLLGAAGVLLPFGAVEVVASLSSLVSLVVFVGVNLAVVLLRRREPDLERPFRVPLRLGWFPLLPGAGVAVSLGLMTQFAPRVYMGAAVAIAAVLALYASRRFWATARTGEEGATEEST